MSDFDWEVVTPPNTNSIMEVAICGGALVVATNEGMLRTEDSGASWSVCETEGPGGWVFDARGDAEGTAYFVGDQGRVWHSKDGGHTFARCDVPKKWQLQGVAFEGDRVWLASAQSGLWYSDSRAKTWVQQTSPSPVGVIYSGICRADDGTLFAAGTEGTVIRSVDGEHWELVRQKGKKFLYGIARTSALMVAPADKGSVFVSTDGGSSFSIKRTETQAYFYAGAVAADTRVWIAGTGFGGPDLLSTDDGKKWMGHELPSGGNVLGLCSPSDNEVWVAAGSALLRGRRTGHGFATSN